MVEASSSPTAPGAVAILLHPSIVPVVDVFRSLSSLEDQYDLALLDGPEQGLAIYTQPEAAKGIVSDALLLAFGLRRERAAPMGYGPCGSRRGTLDEYRLMALLSATYWHDFILASEAAAALDIMHPQPLVSLAFDISRRLEASGLKLDAPDPRLFKPVPRAASTVVVERASRQAEPVRHVDF